MESKASTKSIEYVHAISEEDLNLFYKGQNLETVYSFPNGLIDSNNSYQNKYPPAKLEKSFLIRFIQDFFSLK